MRRRLLFAVCLVSSFHVLANAKDAEGSDHLRADSPRSMEQDTDLNFRDECETCYQRCQQECSAQNGLASTTEPKKEPECKSMKSKNYVMKATVNLLGLAAIIIAYSIYLGRSSPSSHRPLLQ